MSLLHLVSFTCRQAPADKTGPPAGFRHAGRAAFASASCLAATVLLLTVLLSAINVVHAQTYNVGPPNDLAATAGVNQVLVTWGKANWGRSALSGGITHYEFRYSQGTEISEHAAWETVSFGTIPSTGQGDGYTDYKVVKGLTNGTAYTFQVRTVAQRAISETMTVTATPVSQPSCNIDDLGEDARSGKAD